MTTEVIIEAIRHDNKINMSHCKFPCSICNKNVLSNQKAILCDSCNLWCRIKCDGTSKQMVPLKRSFAQGLSVCNNKTNGR